MDKPIIRHCKNCRWCEIGDKVDTLYELKYRVTVDECTVKYKEIEDGRASALFCRHYKQK